MTGKGINLNCPLKIFAALFLSCLSVCGTDTTNTAPKKPALSPVSVLFDHKEPGFTKTWRREYAQALLKDLDAIYLCIPNLKPEQEEWLRKERARADSLDDRKSKAAAWLMVDNSNECAIDDLKRRLGEVVRKLREIISTDQLSTYNWSLVAFTLTERDLFTRMGALEREGIITLPETNSFRDDSKDKDWSLIAQLAGRGIYQHIVFPNLLTLELRAGNSATNSPTPSKH